MFRVRIEEEVKVQRKFNLTNNFVEKRLTTMNK